MTYPALHQQHWKYGNFSSLNCIIVDAGWRMVCKELDLTSTTLELLTHTLLLCVTDPALHQQHWEYGNPTASIASLWKKILNMEIQPVSLPLPHLLCSTPKLQDLLLVKVLPLVVLPLLILIVTLDTYTPSLAMQHTTTAGPPSHTG